MTDNYTQTLHSVTRLLFLLADAIAERRVIGVALGATIQVSTLHATMLATAIAIILLAATRLQGHYKN